MIPSSILMSILVKKVRIKQRTLRYCRNNENKCADICKDSITTSMPLFLRRSTLNVVEKKDTLLRTNFIQPYIDFLPEEGIGGAIYEEFLPPNKDLTYYNKYPATVVELLYIHVELCKFQNIGHIYYDLWLDHFTENIWSTLHMGSKLILKKGKLECHS
ncbi:hypothetical protein Cgig2_001144 [Carnegiea gigantea]|uniref:Uncharacterized protein n=1 Tax=Carnegiea gigantea TaxID=171969 RepID=A0A9Q1K3T9_9CARY|nr:hypothetical protein Cgig2_001144 [Carnegiea gigantea]